MLPYVVGNNTGTEKRLLLFDEIVIKYSGTKPFLLFDYVEKLLHEIG